MKKLLLTSAAALALATVAVSTTKVEAASHSKHVIEHSINDTKSLSAARWGSRLQILNLLTQYKEKLRGGGFYFYQRKFRAEVGKAKTPAQIEELYDKFREELEDLA